MVEPRHDAAQNPATEALSGAAPHRAENQSAHTSHRLPPGAVDCHAHIIGMNLPLSNERHSEPAGEASVTDFLNVLDTHGLDYGVLTAPSFYGPNNEVLLDALAKAKGRLRGTVFVEPDIAEATLAGMQAQGVCGIRLNWVKRPSLPDINAAEYRGLLAKARNLGLHIEVHLEGEHLPPVLKAINASGARAIIDHFGNPQGEHGERSEGFLALLDALQAGNTWVKLSAPNRLRGSDPVVLAERIIRQTGGDRSVWASDWPWVSFEDSMSYQYCLDSLYECVPDERIRTRILTSNAHEAFGFNP